jgi:serine protease AprX
MNITNRRCPKALAALAAIGVGTVALTVAPPTESSASSRVIVATAPGQEAAVADAVSQLGAEVVYEMPNVDSFVIDAPEDLIDDIAALPDVASLGPSSVGSVDFVPSTTGAATAPALLADVVSADELWRAGIDGRGVDVAVIDSGVTPVAGLAGDVVYGPDFSDEALIPNLANLDGLGHGTHMAGIITGQDGASGSTGIAPRSRIVSLKVASHDGHTTVESVIRALDWVVAQKKSKVYNIRVVNLSFGVDGITEYVGDPLSIAVEEAWKAGIVVVVSAGNDGSAATSLGSPATDPYVIAVGAADLAGTAATNDDTIAPFSSIGNALRAPDFVAPGVGIVSQRVPGSLIDEAYPEARIGATMFRGNGTSQSAAVVSGLAALMVQADPTITPDLVKARLKLSATPLANVSSRLQGAGMVDVLDALRLRAPEKSAFQQKFTKSGKDPLKTLTKLREAALKGKTTQNVEAEGALEGNRWRGNRWREDGWKGNRWRGDHWE